MGAGITAEWESSGVGRVLQRDEINPVTGNRFPSWGTSHNEDYGRSTLKTLPIRQGLQSALTRFTVL